MANDSTPPEIANHVGEREPLDWTEITALAGEMWREAYGAKIWPPSDPDMAEVYERRAGAELCRRRAAVLAEREACGRDIVSAVENVPRPIFVSDWASAYNDGMHEASARAIAAIRARGGSARRSER